MAEKHFTYEKIRMILEWIHPVLLFALLVPTCCLFVRERSDSAVCLLYTAGLILLPSSILTGYAGRKVASFPGYLLSCLAGAAVSLAAGYLLGEMLFAPAMRSVYEGEIIAGCLLLTLLSMGIRMQEKGRKKAKKENDQTWREREILLARPSVFGLACFGAAYVAALWNNCPPFCNTALGGGIVYLLIYLTHRYLTVTEAFLRNTRSLTNVPGQKILRLRKGRFLSLLAFFIPVVILSCCLAGARSYRDLRYHPFYHVVPREELLFPGQADPPSLLVPEDGQIVEYGKAPAWTGPVGTVLVAVLVGLVLFLMIRGVISYAHAFGGAPEENGDIAISLAEEETQSMLPARSRFAFSRKPITERERIRREYRKTIRKYRRRARAEMPLPFETPEQIEAGTVFPEGFDVCELHKTYESARYSDTGA